MHGSVGLHSAMAIKRQRRAREEKRRAKEHERRMSSPTTSHSSLDTAGHRRAGDGFGSTRRQTPRGAPPDHRLATSIGMLHLGVVFLVLGMFLVASGLLPSDLVAWRGGGWWNELVATGLFACALGLFLILLNRVVSKKEEDDLNEYVSNQLTRSRSGHRLERDTETGCLATKQHRRHLQMRREDAERGLSSVHSGDFSELPAAVHSPLCKTPPASLPAAYAPNGDATPLEKILEEDLILQQPILEDEDEVPASPRYYPPVVNITSPDMELYDATLINSDTREIISNGRPLPISRM